MNIERKLSVIANPLSDLRYDYIEMSKAKSFNDKSDEINHIKDVYDDEKRDGEVDSIGDMMEKMNVREEDEHSVGKKDNAKNTNFKCDICGTEYKRLGFLKFHIKSKHDGMEVSKRELNLV